MLVWASDGGLIAPEDEQPGVQAQRIPHLWVRFLGLGRLGLRFLGFGPGLPKPPK